MQALRSRLASNPSPMTLDGTRTYVVGRAQPVVIDPGPAEARHLDGLLELLGGARPLAILLTHGHPDHAAAARPLAERTGAPVLMARGGVEAGFPPVRADRWLEDGEAVETDAGPVRAVATPGHTPEHLAFFWTGAEAPAGGALFVGDLMMGEGDTALVAPPEGDLAAYLRSLERVRSLRPGVLLPTHGPPLADPAAAVARYLCHRRERIGQVVRALAAGGPAAPADLVRAVYGRTLDPRLHEAAEGSLRAVLDYLWRQGRVRPLEGGRYALDDSAAARGTL